jgi:hypothetical protein
VLGRALGGGQSCRDNDFSDQEEQIDA